MSLASRLSRRLVSRAIQGVVLAGLALAGCAPERPTYEAVADVKQLMATVVEPAADVYWDAVGAIDDLEGSHEFAPTTDAQWEAVRNAAVVMAESGNLLLVPGRARQGRLWTDLARAMIARGREALAAAEARDPAAVFKAGGEVYLVCSQCHAAYAPQAQRFSGEKEG
jgi:hypothetical protein